MERDGTTLTWHFPLPREHTGVLVGNGVQGLMVWGTEKLVVTVGRSGFWDRRGGSAPMLETTFKQLRTWLEAGDEPSIRRAFSASADPNGGPSHPFQIGAGRLELTLPGGARPEAARLDVISARLEVEVSLPNVEHPTVITIGQSSTTELFWIKLDPALHEARMQLRPSWEFVEEQLADWGYQEPEIWDTKQGGGFVQETPADEALALAWTRNGEIVLCASALGESGIAARESVQTLLGLPSISRLEAERTEWWAAYWADVPEVQLPDPVLQRAWFYGLYKQAGLSPPNGPAATLQGPWMESYQLPPWSNDYHFNINLEMIYSPALVTNRLQHFEPLWKMIEGWFPTLRAYGERFFGAKGALMLPHAVDDRCQVVGQFWTGTIDHACTAWMAILAWQYYRWSMDESTLQSIAWPLLKGAFEGYWAMLDHAEQEPNGSTLSLPVSVSPEFREDKMSAWGRNASFQLAALHAVCNALVKAAAVLGERIDARWERARRELPQYTLFPDDVESALRARPAGDWNPVPRIALWENQDLVESHRHHSHLAAIYPFCSIDPLSDEHRQVVANSLRHWTKMGAGLWTGWCVPWAATICARCNLADAAVSWLHWWNDVYVNEGGGTLHNADFAGATLMDDGGLAMLAGERTERRSEVMQMDAGMGVVSAIAELLVQSRDDTIHVLPKLPKGWRDIVFDGVRTEGAILIGATVSGGVRRSVRIEAKAAGSIRLAHGLEGPWKLTRSHPTEGFSGEPQHGTKSVVSLQVKPGERVEIVCR